MDMKPFQGFLTSIANRFFSPVLLYHATFADIPEKIARRIHNVSPQILREHLTFVKSNFTIVPVDEYAKTKCVRGLAAVTFDDAYKSVFEEALPILEDLDVPFTVFINTSSLEGRVYWRDKVRFIINSKLEEHWEAFSGGKYRIDNLSFYRYTKDPKNNSNELDSELDRFLDQMGLKLTLRSHCIDAKDQLPRHPLITYGNHSRNHYVLSSLSPQEQYDEIASAQRFLDSLTGIQRSQLFSIPFGGLRHFNDVTVRIIRDLGYRGYLLSRNRLNRTVLPGDNLQVIERFMPGSKDMNHMLCALFRKKVLRFFIRP